MHETSYQAELAERIETSILPGSFVLWNDPKRIQGIPDLLVLYGPYWAMLEVKISATAPERPNQRHYIENVFGQMSFSAFIYPEIEEGVLYALQHALCPTG